MNRKKVLNTLGKLSQTEAVLLLLPAICALCYKEFKIVFVYLATAAIAYLLGLLLCVFFKPKSNVIYAKEGFVIVALAWFWISALGAVPFVATGEIPSYVDAFFETVSGFTTTGASILNDVTVLSHGNLFWRSFTHWIGGMGILVFVMAISPNVSDRSIHILKAEMPGPIVGKIVPRVKDTAKILYIIYIAFTVIESILLYIGGMNIFESIVHSFGTAGTGGFGVRTDSIASYSSYCQWIIAVFMVLFGINFNVYFFLFFKRTKNALKSGELWIYISVVVISSVLIGANIYEGFGSFSETFRHSFFQVASIMSTTGYSTQNFDTWPVFSKGILLILMVIGACGGSTAGGLKVSRVVLLFKTIARQIKQLVHPRAVATVKVDGKSTDETIVSGVSVYFAIYAFCSVIIFLLLCFEHFDIETNLSATLACFNNIGPGLGKVGPACSYFGYSGFSKLILSAAMLLGRLEIFPIIIAFMPSTWRKR